MVPTSEVKNMCLDYNDFLMGGPKVSVRYFQTGNPNSDEEMAVALIKYAVTKVFRWNLDDVMRYVRSTSVINDMGLQTAYGKLRFPAEISPDKMPFYIADFIWPNNKLLSKQSMVTLEYHHVLHTQSGKFKKNYFHSLDGKYRMGVCLMDAISKSLPADDTMDLYAQFADEGKASAWVKTWRLDPVKSFFPNCLDMLHSLLPEDRKSEYYYEMFKHMSPVMTKLGTKGNKESITKKYTTLQAKEPESKLETNFGKFKTAFKAKADEAAGAYKINWTIRKGSEDNG